MADQVPPLGHLPLLFDRLQADNDAIPKACMEVINVLSSSEVREKRERGKEEGGR